MQQNIGILDRYVRITGGLLMYAGGFQMRRSFSRGVLLTLGAMKVAEGISGWCPLLYAMGVQTLEDEVQSTAKPRAKDETTTEGHAQNQVSRPQDSQQPIKNETHRSGSQSEDKRKHGPEQKDQSHDAIHNKGQGSDEEILFS